MSEHALPDAQATVEPTEEVTLETMQQAEVEPEKPKETLVPHGALHEEREKRKAAQRELAEARQQALEARQIAENIRQEFIRRQQASNPPPDPRTQPQEALFHQLGTVQQQLTEVQQMELRRQQAEAQRIEAERVTKAAKEMRESYEATVPDYPDAFAHLVNLEKAKALAQGATEAQANEYINLMQERWFFSHVQRGENPFEAAYNLAKQMGYAPQAKKLAMQQAGMRTTKPTGSGGGGNRLTVDALAQMSDAEFAKATADPEAWERLWK